MVSFSSVILLDSTDEQKVKLVPANTDVLMKFSTLLVFLQK